MLCNLPELHTQMTRLRSFPGKGITTQGNKKDDMAVSAIQSIAESITGDQIPELWFETLSF